jgi:hypothetical protein
MLTVTSSTGYSRGNVAHIDENAGTIDSLSIEDDRNSCQVVVGQEPERPSCRATNGNESVDQQ